MTNIVHALIPYTTDVLCGAKSHYRNAMYRESVTCKLCRKHPDFKTLYKPMPHGLARKLNIRKTV